MFKLGLIRAVRPFFQRSLVRSFSDLPDFEELKMPLLSPTMTTGTIIKWIKQEGDTVKAGEVMFEVETDKATLGYEPQDGTVLAKILEPAGGSALPVGHPIAVLVDDTANVPAFASYKASSSPPPAQKAEPAAAPGPEADSEAESAAAADSDAAFEAATASASASVCVASAATQPRSG